MGFSDGRLSANDSTDEEIIDVLLPVQELRADVNKLSVWLARIGVTVGETDGERIVAAVQRLNADVEYWRDEAAARGDEVDRLQKIASRVQDWKEEHQAGQCGFVVPCLHMADLFDVLSEIGEAK